MTSFSSILLDYLGTDVAANRPASLNIAPTALGLYTATDTGVLSAWYSGAWHTVVAGSAISQIIAGSGLAGGTITTSGTISLGTIAATELLGNPGTVAAVPSGIAIGQGLTLPTSGTLAAQWQGGTVSAVGSDLSLNSGTIDIGTITATSLFGNPGTVAAKPSAIAVGTNLTLSAAGTLSASGGNAGTVTQVSTAGGGIAGGPITGSGTLTVEWNAGTVNAVGPEFVEPSGTLHYDQMPTYISASATIDTTYFGKNLVDNSAGTADVVLTLTTLAAATHLTFSLQNNSASHYVRLRPATGVTINGVASSDYLLPNFTGGEVAIDSTGTAYTTGAGLSFWTPSAGYVTALNGLTISNNGTFSTNGTLKPVVDGTSIILSGGTLSATGTTAAGAQFLTYPQTSAVMGGAVSGAFAIRGNVLIVNKGTATISNIAASFTSMVSGGTYQAFVASLNSSLVVTAVESSDTFVSSGSINDAPLFNFATPLVATGSIYVGVGRIDNAGTFSLPLVGSLLSQGYYPMGVVLRGAQFAGTSIAVGTTLASVQVGSCFAVAIGGSHVG